VAVVTSFVTATVVALARRGAVLVGAAAFLMTACGVVPEESPNSEVDTPDHAPSTSRPASSGSETVTVGDGGILPPVASPLAAYKLMGADLYAMQAAESELAGECMTRFGFDPVDLGLDRDATVAEQRDSDTRIYGITDLAEANKYGYQPESVATATDELPVTTASYNFVYTGDPNGGLSIPQDGGELTSPGDFGGLQIPPGGCLGEAREKLSGSPNAEVKDGFAQSLRGDAYNASMADVRVQQLLSRWSACMAAAGFNYQSPLDPEFSREPGSSPSAAEVNTATTDIGCKKKTALIPGWNKVDVEYQEKAIEKNQLQLTEDKDKIQTALKKAAAVLDGN
jgi:hypothetical protein